jgi:hypothetical protein
MSTVRSMLGASATGLSSAGESQPHSRPTGSAASQPRYRRDHMGMLLRRWRHKRSPAARRGREAAHAWAASNSADAGPNVTAAAASGSASKASPCLLREHGGSLRDGSSDQGECQPTPDKVSLRKCTGEQQLSIRIITLAGEMVRRRSLGPNLKRVPGLGRSLRSASAGWASQRIGE